MLSLYIELQKFSTSAYIQQASLILGRFAFYDMIWGYFGRLKLPLKKLMPTHWAPAPNRYELYLSNEVLWVCVASTAAKLQAVGIQKNLDFLGLRLHFSRVYIANRCSSSSPGSIPGRFRLWKATVWQSFDLQECSTSYERPN